MTQSKKSIATLPITPRPPRSTPSGVALLNKPPQSSSHAALAPLKRVLGRRIGHCGTLDPFATGLLIAVSGALTKIASYFQMLPKSYHAEIRFGITTDTLDPTGSAVGPEAAPPSEAQLRDGIATMHGAQRQHPPQYSAVKVNGERAYARARRGQESALRERAIEIYSFDLHRYQPPLATVMLTVSSGTYIRAIARDLALRCGGVAYLTALRRTAIGTIDLRAAHEPAEFQLAQLISPHHLPQINPCIHVFTVPSAYRQRIAHGEPPERLDYFHPSRFSLAAGHCAILFAAAEIKGALEDEPLAICAPRDGRLRYLYVRAMR